MIRKLILITILISVTICLLFFYVKRSQKEVEHIDVKICDEMEIPEMKLTCLAVFKHNPSICVKTGNFDKYCYDSVFTTMENISESVCEKFSEYYPRTTCYLRLAKVKKDPSFCEKTSGKYQMCCWELAKLLKNSTLCKEIEVECERNQCLAEVTGNISFCEKVPDLSEKKMCFAKLSKKLTINVCKEYIPEHPSVLYVPDCIKYVAITTQNISLCDLIDNNEIKWSCLASLSKSMEICKKAEIPFWRDFCEIEFIKENIFSKET